VVCGLALAFSPAAWGSGDRHGGAKKITCNGPGSLSGYFELADDSEVTAKRAECKTAKRVVKRFASNCFKPYAAQTKCDAQARPANSTSIEIEPGGTVVPPATGSLQTKLLDFTLANGVARVEFTHGSISTGDIQGKITLHARADEEQCRAPAPNNRAFELLRDRRERPARPGELPFFSQDRDEGGLDLLLHRKHGRGKPEPPTGPPRERERGAARGA
jgi:hypothetical protein